MLFYKIEVKLPNLEEEYEPSSRARTENNHFIQLKTDEFFAEQNRACHIALSSIPYQKKSAVLCAIVKKEAISYETVEKYLKTIDMKPDWRISIDEITYESYCSMLNVGDRMGYIEDASDILEVFGIENLGSNRHRRGSIEFVESIVEPIETMADMMRMAEALLCDNSLKAEIKRIYQGSQSNSVTGHPVHYLLLADDNEAQSRMLKVLLSALFINGRVKSRRYTQIDYSGDSNLYKESLHKLYKSCADSTVVISYGDEDETECKYARVGADVISGICDVMRSHRSKVLTVFAVKRNAEKVKNVFLEHLGATTVVPISQETVFDKRAKAYLRSRAKEQGATPDRALYRKIKEGTGYTAANLNLMFEEWYDKLLKSKVYTQYAEFETANKQVAERKPKGSAYDELEEMIGLTDAKKIINQALDFYKAQKLFKSKGFTGERPAMHMVFKGNPGTAKTSVARLFAQIMKDNELLSVGDLFEVGRADLVGKYVGWTAQIVKQKFRAAKGSVLFIDEAYSLVDDKDGLFGDEAINTIVQEMENCREDMIVIFAGYTDKMDGFLNKNPGLRSRIAFHVPFDDYGENELYQITELMAKKNKLALASDVREKLTAIYRSVINTDDFGNGRYVRNMFEKAVMRQASRLVAMEPDDVTKTDVTTLLAEDFELPVASKAETLKIGFVA